MSRGLASGVGGFMRDARVFGRGHRAYAVVSTILSVAPKTMKNKDSIFRKQQSNGFCFGGVYPMKKNRLLMVLQLFLYCFGGFKRSNRDDRTVSPGENSSPDNKVCCPDDPRKRREMLGMGWMG